MIVPIYIYIYILGVKDSIIIAVINKRNLLFFLVYYLINGKLMQMINIRQYYNQL